MTVLHDKWAQNESINSSPLWKPKKDKSKQVEQHLKVKIENYKRFAKDWNNNIYFNDKDTEWNSSFFHMMDLINTMCDGNLAWVSFAKYRIDRDEHGNILIHPNLYLAGKWHWKSERRATNKMQSKREI